MEIILPIKKAFLYPGLLTAAQNKIPKVLSSTKSPRSYDSVKLVKNDELFGENRIDIIGCQTRSNIEFFDPCGDH